MKIHREVTVILIATIIILIILDLIILYYVPDTPLYNAAVVVEDETAPVVISCPNDTTMEAIP